MKLTYIFIKLNRPFISGLIQYCCFIKLAIHLKYKLFSILQFLSDSFALSILSIQVYFVNIRRSFMTKDEIFAAIALVREGGYVTSHPDDDRGTNAFGV